MSFYRQFMSLPYDMWSPSSMTIWNPNRTDAFLATSRLEISMSYLKSSVL